ncbi:MAG: YitT family protein [Angelakisella sp.]|jgi:uncharacterized membrane-anchored protein YitT (DUF2179 family)|nr:YitT family protein [Angelakisella sp.]MCI9528309.1 YitT family protein [Angelakisella sp.]
MEQAQHSKSRDILLITFGTLLVALGDHFFKFPNNFSTGGVTGLAVVVSKLIPGVTIGSFVFVVNMALLVVAFLFLSRKFGLATIYASSLMSSVIWAMEFIYPMEAPFTDEPFLELIFSVGLPALGSAILFNIGASTGGTDIIAMLLRKYANIDIGRALLMADILVAVSGCFVFGIKTGLYSILGLLMKSMVVDNVIEGFNLCKYMHIVCTDPEPVRDFIVEKLHRSATICEATGAYTHHKVYLVLTVMTRGQAVILRRYVRSVEPHAFIMVTNTSEIIGKGFRAD